MGIELNPKTIRDSNMSASQQNYLRVYYIYIPMTTEKPVAVTCMNPAFPTF